MWWLWPLYAAAAPAIFQGLIKANGVEGGSGIRVGPSTQVGAGAGAGESGAGATGGGSDITLTNVRGDFSYGGVGCALVYSFGGASIGGSQAGAGGGQAGAGGGQTGAGGGTGDPGTPTARAATGWPAANGVQGSATVVTGHPPCTYTFEFPGNSNGWVSSKAGARRSGRSHQ